MHKTYISAGQLLADSLELGLQIAASSFRPDLILGIWRGGAPVAIAVQEVLEYAGIESDHMAIRTSSYTGIDARSEVRVDGLEYLAGKAAPRALLLVDDVFDTGLSLARVIRELQQLYGRAMPRVKLATPYFKPASNQTRMQPDYFLHTTSDWLVFPHEVLGLGEEEILHKPGLEGMARRLLKLKQQLREFQV